MAFVASSTEARREVSSSLGFPPPWLLSLAVLRLGKERGYLSVMVQPTFIKRSFSVLSSLVGEKPVHDKQAHTKA